MFTTPRAPLSFCRTIAPIVGLLSITLACASDLTGDGTTGGSVTAGTGDMSLLDGSLIDLTYPLSPESIYWPTGEPFRHERLAWGQSEGGYWYAAASFSSPEHLGTHIDAPIHFAEHGWTAADIPIDRLVGPGALIDISSRAEHAPDTTLRPTDIEGWERTHGSVPRSGIVIVRTGWESRWPDWSAYYGTDTPMDVATLHFPGVSPDAARLLVDRGVAGVGIDTASIDPGSDTGFSTHQVLAAAGLFNLENLTNLAGLPDQGFVVLAMPMKIAGGTGGPARVVAQVPSRSSASGQ